MPRFAGRLVPVAIFRIEDVADVQSELRVEDLCTAIHFVSEGGKSRVKLPAHADVMVAHAGKQQDHRVMAAILHSALC